MNKIFLGFFLFAYTLSAQEIVPYFKNYTKLDYNGENSSWDLAQHSDGTLYVANGTNLLAFNGDYWEKYQLKDPLLFRSVEVVDDTIYTGAYHEFGYWVRNKKNKLFYTSLSDTFGEQIFDNDEIWKIFPYRDQIIFQSFDKLFKYHRRSKKLEIIPFPDVSAIFCFLIGDQIYLTTRNNGIYKLIEDKFTFVEWSTPLKNSAIQGMVPFKEGFLIATQLNGIYYYNGTTLSLWRPSHNEINNIEILNGFVCVGTINNGLLVLDEEGDILYRINKQNGLANNTVLRQLVDKKQNLWLGLDNGLSKIYLSDSIYSFKDRTGTLGTVYTVLEDSGGLVLGSNHGVFYLREERGLEFLEGSNGQVWNLTRVGDEIIVGHNNGTFRIKNNRFKFINGINGGMDFKNIPGTKFYIQPNYTGIARYQKRNGNWLYKRYSSVDFPVKAVVFDENGNLWMEAMHRGIFQYEFKNDYEELQLKKKYKPLSSNTELFNIGNKIFIVESGEIFKYDIVNDTIVKDELLTRKLSPFEDITSIGHDFLAVKNENSLTLTEIKSGEQFLLNDDFTTTRVVQNFPGTTAIGNKIFILMDDGFLKVFPSVFSEDTFPNSVKIELVKVKGEFVPNNIPIEIPFKRNQIQFWYSGTSPGSINLNQYSHKLEGYESDWSVPASVPQVTYSNLPAGDFIFKVRIMNPSGEMRTDKFAFTILQPWYFTRTAWIVYISMLLVVLFLIFYFNKSRFNRKKKNLLKEMEYEQKLALQKQNFENRRKTTQFEQEKLKSRLRSKSRELASYAALMARKEDILNEMEREINNSTIKNDDHRLYSKLIDIKNKQAHSQDEWKLFESNFNEVHEDFFKILQNKFPDLTPKDLKLCAYLRMNLSSKEIAPLSGITFRSVELHRYRLRKKLHLSKNQNLVKFLLKIG